MPIRPPNPNPTKLDSLTFKPLNNFTISPKIKKKDLYEYEYFYDMLYKIRINNLHDKQMGKLNTVAFILKWIVYSSWYNVAGIDCLKNIQKL